ncbi:Protein of unknown function [Alteromonadaceae bacterium Bs31]|nr:Protein of unknown function [Alteromonadaceae bacterium Bs31]
MLGFITRPRSLRILAFVAGLSLLGACSSPDISQYEGTLPLLDVKDYFDGHLSAHGIVKNRAGKVIRTFNADITASWSEEGIGRLHETFLFSDGEEQIRVWQLVPLGDGKYRASANDVVGESVLVSAGNALFLNYILEVPYKDGTMPLRVDDRMYLVNDQMLINESILKKFGIRVASVTLVIVKH